MEHNQRHEDIMGRSLRPALACVSSHVRGTGRGSPACFNVSTKVLRREGYFKFPREMFVLRYGGGPQRWTEKSWRFGRKRSRGVGLWFVVSWGTLLSVKCSSHCWLQTLCLLLCKICGASRPVFEISHHAYSYLESSQRQLEYNPTCVEPSNTLVGYNKQHRIIHCFPSPCKRSCRLIIYAIKKTQFAPDDAGLKMMSILDQSNVRGESKHPLNIMCPCVNHPTRHQIKVWKVSNGRNRCGRSPSESGGQDMVRYN